MFDIITQSNPAWGDRYVNLHTLISIQIYTILITNNLKTDFISYKFIHYQTPIKNPQLHQQSGKSLV
jgi:hypothetical protein